jgi:uroporphyrinogen decarboxylase
MDHLTGMWIRIYEKVVEKVRIDHIHMWEDMSGRQGSLISPEMVKKFMIPNYKKIKKFADQNNIPVFSVDTDGWVGELLPLFIEGGINLVWPFEVAAGSDIIGHGKDFPDLCIMGGIDKRQLAKDRKAIDVELERISPMFERGRYIAGLDHGIPPDVSWDNMRYYIRNLRKYIFKHGG